jgi:hypothetical protein
VYRCEILFPSTFQYLCQLPYRTCHLLDLHIKSVAFHRWTKKNLKKSRHWKNSHILPICIMSSRSLDYAVCFHLHLCREMKSQWGSLWTVSLGQQLTSYQFNRGPWSRHVYSVARLGTPQREEGRKTNTVQDWKKGRGNKQTKTARMKS